jgi:hypothetical protein
MPGIHALLAKTHRPRIRGPGRAGPRPWPDARRKRVEAPLEIVISRWRFGARRLGPASRMMRSPYRRLLFEHRPLLREPHLLARGRLRRLRGFGRAGALRANRQRILRR